MLNVSMFFLKDYISTALLNISLMLNSFIFLLAIESISFVLKAILLIIILIHLIKATRIKFIHTLLLLVMIGAMTSDLAWIVSLSHKIFPGIPYEPVICTIRLAWIWCIIEYQSLALFIESLIEKNYKIKRNHYFFLFISTILGLLFLFIAIYYYSDIDARPPLEHIIIKSTALYVFIPVLLSLQYANKTIKQQRIPKIISRQFKVLLKWLIIPHIISDFIQHYPSDIFQISIASNYAMVSVSTILLTLAFYFCAKKMMGLRFLNLNNHVSSYNSFGTLERFKDVLGQLSKVTEIKELSYITESFFKSHFGIGPKRVTLIILKPETQTDENHLISHKEYYNPLENTIELFMHPQYSLHQDIKQFLFEHKILITDEIAFNDFYHDTLLSKAILDFLNTISADIFLPVYQGKNIVAYVIVEQGSRPDQFYTDVERDELVIFASYLGNIINLLHTNNIQKLFEKDKDLQEELYQKHQEIAQYKESIRSFLRDTKEKKIGIIFYKNRKFSFGNQAAKELIPINIHTQEGHPLTKQLYKIAQQVEEYKTNQTTTVKSDQDQLVFCGFPHGEHHTIIILVYRPEISDIIKSQIDLLKDPSDWDYLLYLERTESGRLIKRLFPGNEPQLLKTQISLLKAALSTKAFLIDVPKEDEVGIVELLHHISLRETLHTLTISNKEQEFEYAIKLFGINALYHQKYEQGLLESLHNTGTLFIRNIDFLHIETQKQLAEYIRYGFFTLFKSNTKIISNVRIICSSSQPLGQLVKQGSFSPELYTQINETKLIIPPLLSLSRNDLLNLAEHLTEQAIQQSHLEPLIGLTEREKVKIIESAPISMHEFKEKIQQLLIKKTKQKNIDDPVINVKLPITDPEFALIASLGKNALKDPKILSLLMEKFKNQSKIATFLGVNRSSVHRRCKEHNIAP